MKQMMLARHGVRADRDRIWLRHGADAAPIERQSAEQQAKDGEVPGGACSSQDLTRPGRRRPPLRQPAAGEGA
jgi:hypothetical protein